MVFECPGDVDEQANVGRSGLHLRIDRIDLRRSYPATLDLANGNAGASEHDC